MSKSITIHDIARKAGVSPSTVSRVLNGNTPVAEDKRNAVLAVISQLKYRPSAVAQGLARGRTGAVGVLTQSISSPFYGEILRGIEEVLQDSDYHPVFASGNWHTDEELAAIELLSGRRVDALIVLGGLSPEEHLRDIAALLPLVIVGRTVAGLEHCCLRVDDCQGAFDATNYLIGLGHQRIVHITGHLLHQDAQDRRTGYLEAMSATGLPLEPSLVIEGDFTEQSGMLAVQSLLSRAVRFSAIFAGNDQMAYGARLALFRYGIRVPEDVSIIGFDDLPVSAYTTPPLTTIRQPTHTIGQAAADMLLKLLAGEHVHAPPPLATELVARESVAMNRTVGA